MSKLKCLLDKLIERKTFDVLKKTRSLLDSPRTSCISKKSDITKPKKRVMWWKKCFFLHQQKKRYHKTQKKSSVVKEMVSCEEGLKLLNWIGFKVSYWIGSVIQFND